MSTELTTSTLLMVPATQTEVLAKYKLEITEQEVRFLRWFFDVSAIATWSENFLLELCVAADLARKNRDRFLAPKSEKWTFRAHEMIALKRLLFEPALEPEANAIRDGLLAKIDPLTVGII